MMAPAVRSLVITKASFTGVQFCIALDPAVVGISCVSMLSLTRTGIQNRGRRFYLRWIRRGIPFGRLGGSLVRWRGI
jgi:hypothetical protein